MVGRGAAHFALKQHRSIRLSFEDLARFWCKGGERELFGLHVPGAHDGAVHFFFVMNVIAQLRERERWRFSA